MNNRFQHEICIFRHRGCVSVIHLMLLHDYDLVKYWDVFDDKQ